MTAQLALSLPAYRRTDPESSAVAAASVAGAQQQSECKLLLRVLLLAALPLTYREAHELVQDTIHEAAEVNRRLDDLRKGGFIRTSDRRKCRISGRLAQTWEIAR